ncbi:MAG: ATP-binding protein [Gemmatimonadota bacterium]
MRLRITPAGRAFWITAIYLVVGAVWIAWSDAALLTLVEDPAYLSSLQTLKGWAYVGLSGLLVFALSLASLRGQAREAEVDRRLRTVLDAIPTRVSWKDTDGRYLGCNAAFAEDMGLPGPEAVAGLMDADLLPADQVDGARLADRRVVETGEPLRHNRIPVMHEGGELAWYDAYRVPVQGAAGEVEGLLFCYDDVTHGVLAELELRQGQKVQEVGRLTSGIVHDFKNVLAVILANADLVEGGRLSRSEVEEAFQDIRRAADSAYDVVRKLLGFTGKADLVKKPTDVRWVLEGMAAMLSRLLRQTHGFRVELPEALPRVLCDVNAVEHMLLNLVSNARDAMPERTGEIVVRLEEVVLDPETSSSWWSTQAEAGPVTGQWVALSVADSGMGIALDLLPRIFEAFYTTKSGAGGTGLGLPMVMGLMEQHGGVVQVKSEVGKGTTVRLLFPPLEEGLAETEEREETMEGGRVVEPVPDSVVGEASAAGPRRSGTDGSDGRDAQSHPSTSDAMALTVLVVEDQADLRRTVLRALRHSGFQVLEAGEGNAALELIRGEAHELDLVLSDLAMPGMGGMDLYRTMRAEGFAVPFAITSGEADLAEVAESPDERAIPMIPKPWTVQELVAGVRNAMDGPPRE